MKVSVLPAASDELRETAKFYSERADQALGMAFIAEFERALNLLSHNPELGAVWHGTARRFPYWVFGWNYLNPGSSAHEIIVLGDQPFCFSIRTFGVHIPGGSGWAKNWKDQNLPTYEGYISIRDLLRNRSNCEPKFVQFPLQPKLCRRWWAPEHHTSCGAILDHFTITLC